MEILDCHKLSKDHFSTMEEANRAADIMVAGLKANFPHMEEEHPDVTVPGMSMLDQFWYFKHEGTPGNPHLHIKVNNMCTYIYIYIFICIFAVFK